MNKLQKLWTSQKIYTFYLLYKRLKNIFGGDLLMVTIVVYDKNSKQTKYKKVKFMNNRKSKVFHQLIISPKIYVQVYI